MTPWIIMTVDKTPRTQIKKYVFLYLFSGTLSYTGEMKLCVIYPIPLSMVKTDLICKSEFLSCLPLVKYGCCSCSCCSSRRWHTSSTRVTAPNLTLYSRTTSRHPLSKSRQYFLPKKCATRYAALSTTPLRSISNTSFFYIQGLDKIIGTPPFLVHILKIQTRVAPIVTQSCRVFRILTWTLIW